MDKILIVDDNARNIQLLGNILSEQNYEVEYAMNGEEAIEMVKSDNFDLILMDIMMPEMDGYEACLRIKTMEGKSEIPLIFLTAKTDIDSITHGFNIGGVDYISKPFNEAELLSRIETHISLKKSKDELKNINSILEQKVQDRTLKLRESNIELTHAKSELEVLDTAKNDFLRIISHEIRTPLTGILGFVDLIKNETNDKVVLEMINYLDNSCNRLEHFSITALEVSTLQTNKEKALSKKLTDIRITLEDITLSLQNEKDVPTTNISTSIENCPFYFDAQYIHKCLKVLILNALTHSAPNDLVSVVGKKNNNFYTITISDNGNGFPESIIKNGINAFVTSQHVDCNPCLDLYLCKLIVEAHVGNLALQNDNGAKIEVSIPCK